MIYIGVTNDLERRIYDHKKKWKKGFTKEYNLLQLVYYEETDDIGRALERERKAVKKVEKTKESRFNRVHKS